MTTGFNLKVNMKHCVDWGKLLDDGFGKHLRVREAISTP